MLRLYPQIDGIIKPGLGYADIYSLVYNGPQIGNKKLKS